MSIKLQRPKQQKFIRTIPAEGSEKFDWVRVYVHEYYNVRKEPNPTSPVLHVLRKGSHVEVEKSGRPWLKVRKDEETEVLGYVTGTIMDNQIERSVNGLN